MKHYNKILDRRVRVRWLIAAVAIAMGLMLAAIQAKAQTVEGNFVNWNDGDTGTFREVSGRYRKVRLSGIDAPESRQTHGIACRNLFRTSTSGKTIQMQFFGQDVYKRWLGRASVEPVGAIGDYIPDLALHLLENGCAWEYGSSLDVKTSYQNAEQTARTNEIGLWFEPSPMAPIQFRTGAICP